jgi:hypothetical protein
MNLRGILFHAGKESFSIRETIPSAAGFANQF